MQIKHAVTTSADTSSLGGCEMRWMSRDEGSDKRSRSLVCSSVMGVEDARMTSVKEREIGWCENLLRANECSSLVKLSRFMSVVLLDASVVVKKGGYIPMNLIMCFKYISCRRHLYCLRVALCLHLESPLSRFPPHSMACLRGDRTTGSGFLTHRRHSRC